MILIKPRISRLPNLTILVGLHRAESPLRLIIRSLLGETKVSPSIYPSNANLTSANAISYRQATPVKPRFIAYNRQFIGATVEALKFNESHSTDVINTRANEKTKGRIKGIADGMINPLSGLFLANAVYFKGKREVPFEMKSTKDRTFYLREGTQKKLSRMEQARKFTCRRGPGYEAVRLPLVGGNLATQVFLPEAGSSAGRLFGILNGATWQRLTGPGFTQRQGTVVLPRIKLEYGVEPKQPLETLGMKAAFNRKADFSGVSGEPLEVEALRQRTFAEVNEEGTEAATVTAATLKGMRIEMNAPKPFEMIMDRPFLFLIEDGQTMTILFMGVEFYP